MRYHKPGAAAAAADFDRRPSRDFSATAGYDDRRRPLSRMMGDS